MGQVIPPGLLQNHMALYIYERIIFGFALDWIWIYKVDYIYEDRVQSEETVETRLAPRLDTEIALRNKTTKTENKLGKKCRSNASVWCGPSCNAGDAADACVTGNGMMWPRAEAIAVGANRDTGGTYCFRVRESQ